MGTVPEFVECFVVCGSQRAHNRIRAIVGLDRSSFRISFSHKSRNRGGFPISPDELVLCMQVQRIRLLSKESKAILWKEA